MDIEQRDMQQKAALKGLVFGLIILIIGVAALYFIAHSKSMAVVIGSPILLSFIIPVLLAVFFCINLRKQIGGYWTMRQATSGIFVLFITAYLVYSAGNYLHATFIDTHIHKKVKENIVNVTIDFASKQKVPAEKIDEKIEEMQASLQDESKPTAGKIIQGIVFSIIIIFLGSLIFAAIFKKEPPVFEPENDASNLNHS